MQDIIRYLEKNGKHDFAHRLSTVVGILDEFLDGKSVGAVAFEREESQDKIEHLTKKSHALAHELTLMQKTTVELLRRVKKLEEEQRTIVYGGVPRVDAIGRPFSELLFNPVGISIATGDAPLMNDGFKTFGRSAFDPEPLPHEFKEENGPSRNNID